MSATTGLPALDELDVIGPDTYAQNGYPFEAWKRLPKRVAHSLVRRAKWCWLLGGSRDVRISFGSRSSRSDSRMALVWRSSKRADPSMAKELSFVNF